jgi:hypothetical protein
MPTQLSVSPIGIYYILYVYVLYYMHIYIYIMYMHYEYIYIYIHIYKLCIFYRGILYIYIHLPFIKYVLLLIKNIYIDCLSNTYSARVSICIYVYIHTHTSHAQYSRERLSVPCTIATIVGVYVCIHDMLCRGNTCAGLSLSCTTLTS